MYLSCFSKVVFALPVSVLYFFELRTFHTALQFFQKLQFNALFYTRQHLATEYKEVFRCRLTKQAILASNVSGVKF